MHFISGGLRLVIWTWQKERYNIQTHIIRYGRSAAQQGKGEMHHRCMSAQMQVLAKCKDTGHQAEMAG